MRLMRINTRKIHYALYEGLGDYILDEDGYRTSEREVLYSDPVQIRANVSPAGGEAWAETFGTLENYDRIIITDDMSCPIDENSILWVEVLPDEANDYRVYRVAKFLNHIAYAVKKVDVGG